MSFLETACSQDHHSVAGHYRGAGGLGPLGGWEGCVGCLETAVGRKQLTSQEGPDCFSPVLVYKYNPLNLTALDWSLLSKKECLNYGGRLLGNSCQFIPDLALMSFILFFGTYSMTLTLKKFKFSRYFPTKVTSPYSQTVHMEATTESLRGFWSNCWNGHHISTCSLRFFQVKSTDFGSERTGFPCCQAP